ncbi:MAG: ABC transporter ATP-binding protein [Candidatus Accumulibacter sp.]|uniref:ABC transporter ATP-binding protein n=1 Tax=Candidatus Accumulibacter affinis TaxID=2954384 RepID=A0A935T7Q7_9PROT|nr:ABC transporter ATP-binding protein [Candidatus Accumulibacter affinis]
MSFDSGFPGTSPTEVAVEKIAMSVRNISKRYQIYDSPGDRLKQFVLPRLRRIAGRAPRHYFREFSALSDVSFDIRKGETFGIIGRNGAGKSTLLQILCGTLTPTAGSVDTHGRVAALLELGSGFNSDFTGRENVYMNASVLGLSKEETEERFEDIAAFADIGDFLEQPVKTYSSGMYVRLAFSVVVHVSADILIIDEALSVGDIYFQAKCMAHLKKLMASGVTVLFVSHDVSAVKALCSRAVYIDRGQVVLIGSTDDVVEAYYGAAVKSSQLLQESPSYTATNLEISFSETDLAEQREFAAAAAFHRLKNGMADLLNVRLINKSGQKTELVEFGQAIVLRVVFRCNIDLPTVGLAYHIRDRNGFDVIYSDTEIERCHVTNLRSGEIISMEWEFDVNLREGVYSIAIMLSDPTGSLGWKG